MISTYSTNACARLSMLSLSRFVVGSSKASIPQFKQNVSARARRMIRDASTYKRNNTDYFIREKLQHCEDQMGIFKTITHVILVVTQIALHFRDGTGKKI